MLSLIYTPSYKIQFSVLNHFFIFYTPEFILLNSALKLDVSRFFNPKHLQKPEMDDKIAKAMESNILSFVNDFYYNIIVIILWLWTVSFASYFLKFRDFLKYFLYEILLKEWFQLIKRERFWRIGIFWYVPICVYIILFIKWFQVCHFGILDSDAIENQIFFS